MDAIDTGIVACGETHEHSALQNGFGHNYQPPPQLLSGRVQAITAAELVIRPDDGEPLVFRSTGPSLLNQFELDEAVHYGAVSGSPSTWHLVIGARATVAALSGFSNTSLPRHGKVPGGPDYVAEPQCGFVEPSCHDDQVIVSTLFTLHAMLDHDSASIPLGATGSVGGWRVTNVWLNETRVQLVGTKHNCVIDPMDYFDVMAIGPATNTADVDAGL